MPTCNCVHIIFICAVVFNSVFFSSSQWFSVFKIVHFQVTTRKGKWTTLASKKYYGKPTSSTWSAVWFFFPLKCENFIHIKTQVRGKDWSKKAVFWTVEFSCVSYSTDIQGEQDRSHLCQPLAVLVWTLKCSIWDVVLASYQAHSGVPEGFVVKGWQLTIGATVAKRFVVLLKSTGYKIWQNKWISWITCGRFLNILLLCGEAC